MVKCNQKSLVLNILFGMAILQSSIFYFIKHNTAVKSISSVLPNSSSTTTTETTMTTTTTAAVPQKRASVWKDRTYRRAQASTSRGVSSLRTTKNSEQQHQLFPLKLVCQLSPFVYSKLDRFATCYGLKLWLEQQYKFDVELVYKLRNSKQFPQLKLGTGLGGKLVQQCFEQKKLQDGGMKMKTKSIPINIIEDPSKEYVVDDKDDGNKGEGETISNKAVRNADPNDINILFPVADNDIGTDIAIQDMPENLDHTLTKVYIAMLMKQKKKDGKKNAGIPPTLYFGEDGVRNPLLYIDRYYHDIQMYLKCKQECTYGSKLVDNVDPPSKDETVLFLGPKTLSVLSDCGGGGGQVQPSSPVETFTRTVLSHLLVHGNKQESNNKNNKVVVVSRADTADIEPYLNAIQKLKIPVRLVVSKNAIHEYCFLSSSMKEMIGSSYEDTFVLAGLLSDSVKQTVLLDHSPINTQKQKNFKWKHNPQLESKLIWWDYIHQPSPLLLPAVAETNVANAATQ